MSDSQRPNPPLVQLVQPARFEVPDLELEPLPRSVRQAVPAPAPATTRAQLGPSRAPDQSFGASFDFGDELEDLEFERTAQPNVQTAEERAARAQRAAPVAKDVELNWPTGLAPDPAQLLIDPLELAILAGYGDPPDRVPLTLGYAYRVFTRQRQLKQQLIPVAAESERAQLEREATLAEFARSLRPALEPLGEFRRFFARLVELERRAHERARALRAINTQLGAETGQFDAELTQIVAQSEVEERLERDAQRQHDDREADAQRANAKWKRVQIEMRALTHVAERKLGAPGAPNLEPETARLSALQQRAEALLPDVTQARGALEQAKQALAQVQARHAALRQNERQITRKKQALGGAYEKELSARSQGVSELEIEQRAALADLGRAVLAARGKVEVPEAWLVRLRKVSDHADRLLVRAEMQRRAIVAYDIPRARQGVRLACTAVVSLLLLFAFKLIF
ncbi:MAG TPA: hypothetical protein VJV79_09235 [Polyangiaceae bacterium]|nr:hypothetical protein [Polyangiaceae bacterium]